MIRLLILSLAVFVNIQCLANPGKGLHQIVNLNSNWVFTSKIYGQYYPASIPGSVHTDLLNNNLIADPFVGKNEQQLQWIDSTEWIYKTEFKKPKVNSGDQVEIVFKGLDTYADVFINDSLFISTDNMFLPWKIRIDPQFLKRKNTLTVVFKPASKHAFEEYKKLNYELPGGERSCVRKASYQYGWDWAPKYVSAGIWQDVELHVWNKAKINNVQYSVEKLDSAEASVLFKMEVESDQEFFGSVLLQCPDFNISQIIEKVPFAKGKSTLEYVIRIQNPQFWWTHNLGEPFLYHFNVDITHDKELLDRENLKIGLRTIELVQEPDQYGESFYFRLNGVPVFMKGANYVPQSSFPGCVSEHDYRQLISDAKNANMNMLRVWGGGIYEKDIFYKLCDEYGILIWQDFMFANTMFPNDSVFLQNIKKEAEFQLNRLSKHPSIALWCGNNEIDEAWHNWGWPRTYSKTDSAEIWNNYQYIFHDLLPGLVKNFGSTISYTSTSPLFGRGNGRSNFEGDNHYWYVWHDAYDFEWYNQVTGRFMSEFGFQSFPAMETIGFFDSSSTKSANSEVMLAHQKHHKGNFLINHYMQDYYPVPDKLEDFVYLSQVLQAEGIRTGILAQRRAKPFCMGSLYWQLNDCWPAISWSGIDYFGNWKALHHFAKQDFKNIILAPYLYNDSLELFLVSDSLHQLTVQVHLQLMDFYGQSKMKKSFTVHVKPNSSQSIYKVSVAEILDANSPKNHFIYAELAYSENIIDTRTILFDEPKNLDLDENTFYSKYNKIKGGYEIILKSAMLIKSMCIEPLTEGELSENFFDLIPGKEKRIIFKSRENLDIPPNYFEYKTLNEILNEY